MMRYKERLVFLFIGAWFLCSFVGLYIFRTLSVFDQRDQGHASLRKRDFGLTRHPGFRALRLWATVVNSNETASRLTEDFLEEVMANRSKVVSLDLIGELWKRFRSEFAEFEAVKMPTKLSIEEFIEWGQFVQYLQRLASGLPPEGSNVQEEEVEEEERRSRDMKAKQDNQMDLAVVDYEEYPEPPYRPLSKDMLNTLLTVLRQMNKSRVPKRDLGEKLNIHHTHKRKAEQSLPAWRRLQNHMRRHQLYASDDPAVDEALHNLRTQPIVGLEIKPGAGTQNKLFYRLKDGGRALAKPKRMPIHIETPPETYQFDDFEKFYGEVSSFHLDRVMGFNRVPPATSRYINLTTDVRKIAPYELKKTFYRSHEGALCFYGICQQFCDTPFAVCGKPDLIPVSMAFFLPSRQKVDRISWDNPYKQSYSRFEKAEWEVDEEFCRKYILSDEFFTTTRRLLDIIDMHIFDFIQGNLDRHHYHSFSVFGNDSNIFLYDNGRAFARAYRDDMGILAPMIQCGLVRLSTLERLLMLYLDEVSLGEKLRISLQKEVVRPLLTNKHIRAVDRRLVIVLETIYDTIMAAGGRYRNVVQDDGY